MKAVRIFLLILFCCGALSMSLFQDRVQSQSPTDKETLLLRNNNLGVAHMEQLSFESAAAQFARNVEIDPAFVPGQVNLGIAEYYRQNYERAVEAFEAALRLDPDQIRAHYMLGLIFRQTNQNERAIQSFLQVSRQDPRDPSTLYYLGLSYQNQRDFVRAVDYLRRAVESQPYNASAYYNLGQALMKAGEREQAQQAFETFQKLRGQFGSETVGLQYLEQGQYAQVIDHLPGLQDRQVETGSRNRFLRRSVAAGPSQPVSPPSSLDYRNRADLEARIVPYLGSGATFGDADGDGNWDVLVAGPGGNRLYLKRGQEYVDATTDSGLAGTGNTMLALWGDFNNDLKSDLYLINYGPNSLWLNLGEGRFRDHTAETGTGDASWGVAGTVVDFDHDGDLDILVANLSTGPGAPLDAGRFPDDLPAVSNVLFRNNGDGSFTDVTQASGLAASRQRSTAAWISDVDNSRDIDLIFNALGSGGQLWTNQRDGSFRERAGERGLPTRSSAILIPADLSPDGAIDLLAAAAGQTRLLVNRSNRFENSTSPPWPPISTDSGFRSIQAADIDNDGDLDLIGVAGPRLLRDNPEGQSPLSLWERQTSGYVDVTAERGLALEPATEVRGLSVVDADGDGDLDLLIGVNGRPPILFANQGEAGHGWVQVALEGTGSNRQGIGTKVEILAGSLWQKLEIQGGQGFLSQSPPVAHFGLGRGTHLDVVRLLWPGGVLQAEIDPAQNQYHRLRELDRKGTSCPILYVWNGTGYQFQTDFLGGSAFGSLLGPGIYNVPDSDEYIRLDPDLLQLQEGRVAVSLNNQLEEVIFFDQVELIAVDHPSTIEVHPDEKLLPGPPYDPFRLITVANARVPVGAWDAGGRDLRSSIAAIDRHYPELFQPLPYKGYAQTHEMVLDLGPLSNQHASLLLYAWIDYADSTSNLAAAQAGLHLVPPYLQVEDPDGNWVTAIERMGFPAGLPKTMTVDLSGKFLSDSRRIRIVTNMRIHWDQILVDDSPPFEGLRLHRLNAETARLSAHGFPRFSRPDGREPRIYHHQESDPAAAWKTHIGGYTRFGEVSPLLTRAEDFYVITRSGDQIEARFDVRGLPELPSGWKRTYLLHVNGFGKDMDINSAAPDFVGPLPFHGMPSYPYPEGSYPMDDAHIEYLRRWNTRIVQEWLSPLTSPAGRFPGLPTPR